jgi:hypothetical protein
MRRVVAGIDGDGFHSAGIANDLSMVCETHGRRACSVNVNGATISEPWYGPRLSRFLVLAVLFILFETATSAGLFAQVPRGRRLSREFRSEF